MSLVDEVGSRFDGLDNCARCWPRAASRGFCAHWNLILSRSMPARLCLRGLPANMPTTPSAPCTAATPPRFGFGCGCAVHSRLTAEQAYTTLDLTVSYHRPISRIQDGCAPKGACVPSAAGGIRRSESY